MSWTILGFGKHSTITLPQLLFIDPDYFYWAYDEEVLRGRIPLTEIQDAYDKSRNIKIPEKDRHAEYVFDGFSGVFADLKLVPIDRPPHVGTSKTLRLDRIDMARIRYAKTYDKLGYKLLIPSMKQILFGSSKTRISKAKAEVFFENPDNFLI